MRPAPLMEQAAAALVEGDWQTARTCFETALRDEETPEAMFGLGTALWWLGETSASVRAHERAYAQFRRRPDPPSAALAAIALCLTYRASLGNHAASRGWIGRLSQLVEEYELVPLHGWLALCRAVEATDMNEPVAAEACARESLEIARRTGDVDLELCALSELGAALVQKGQVGEGAALLDQAMAGALGGEGDRLETVVFAGCRSIIACTRALEIERAVQWIRAAQDFTQRYGNLHLYTVCRTQYGSILFGLGRWAEAEDELRAALRIGKSAERAVYGQALANLAELRVAQGRVDEAAELLKGFEDHVVTALPRARIHLCRGEPEIAAVVLDRQLDAVGEQCLEAMSLCELRAEVDLALGDADAARDRARGMVDAAEQNECAILLAHGERALGHAYVAENTDEAVRRLGRALVEFDRVGLLYEAARTHLLLARAFGSGERAAAVAEASRALATFDRLGAVSNADETAAYLRGLGERPGRQGPGGTAHLTQREREVLRLLGLGLSNRELGERLFLSRKTVEHHVRAVLTKLGLRNRAEAAAYAVRHELSGES